MCEYVTDARGTFPPGIYSKACGVELWEWKGGEHPCCSIPSGVKLLFWTPCGCVCGPDQPVFCVFGCET